VRRAAPVAIVACALAACGVEDWSFDTVDGHTVDSGEEGSASHAEASNSGCTSDADCILPTLHCDGASGQCVACVTNAQCEQEGIQEGLKVCDTELERCVQCDFDADCPPDRGLGCQPTSHECVPACMTDEECPRSAPQCSGGLCVACTANQDCAGGGGPVQAPICDSAIGQCAECTQDPQSQCPLERPKCDRTIDRCVGCLSSVDCAPNEGCDPEREVCTTGPLDASTRDAPDMADSTTGR
jgi:hypothetical protein